MNLEGFCKTCFWVYCWANRQEGSADAGNAVARVPQARPNDTWIRRMIDINESRRLKMELIQFACLIWIQWGWINPGNQFIFIFQLVIRSRYMISIMGLINEPQNLHELKQKNNMGKFSSSPHNLQNRSKKNLRWLSFLGEIDGKSENPPGQITAQTGRRTAK